MHVSFMYEYDFELRKLFCILKTTYLKAHGVFYEFYLDFSEQSENLTVPTRCSVSVTGIWFVKGVIPHTVYG